MITKFANIGFPKINGSFVELTQKRSVNGWLYNYYVVANIAPTDWKVPSVAEWTILSDYLGGATVSGGKLKSTLTTQWTQPNLASNTSGFSAFGSGYRSSTDSLFKNAFYAHATDTLSSQSYHLRLDYDSVETILAQNSQQYYGKAIRLLYDGVGDPGATLTDYEGNVYDVIQIGTQYWTKQNWKCNTLNDGTPIILQEDYTTWVGYASTEIPARCAYDNDLNNI